MKLLAPSPPPLPAKIQINESGLQLRQWYFFKAGVSITQPKLKTIIVTM